ncbi:Protein of unknown function [Cotesia congregata]|uniref:Uncharacterized protein n=1 Tax=Cotesia congregata TaxID=51543 RepID=A0A8J2MQ93_COTCN|nr:Protein of unknown function [Cotesia congregata]
MKVCHLGVSSFLHNSVTRPSAQEIRSEKPGLVNITATVTRASLNISTAARAYRCYIYNASKGNIKEKGPFVSNQLCLILCIHQQNPQLNPNPKLELSNLQLQQDNIYLSTQSINLIFSHKRSKSFDISLIHSYNEEINNFIVKKFGVLEILKHEDDTERHLTLGENLDFQCKRGFVECPFWRSQALVSTLRWFCPSIQHPAFSTQYIVGTTASKLVPVAALDSVLIVSCALPLCQCRRSVSRVLTEKLVKNNSFRFFGFKYLLGNNIGLKLHAPGLLYGTKERRDPG